MINTIDEYKRMKEHLSNFKKAYDQHPEEIKNVHPTLVDASKRSILSKIHEFEEEIKEYEINHPEISQDGQ